MPGIMMSIKMTSMSGSEISALIPSWPDDASVTLIPASRSVLAMAKTLRGSSSTTRALRPCSAACRGTFTGARSAAGGCAKGPATALSGEGRTGGTGRGGGEGGGDALAHLIQGRQQFQGGEVPAQPGEVEAVTRPGGLPGPGVG